MNLKRLTNWLIVNWYRSGLNVFIFTNKLSYINKLDHHTSKILQGEADDYQSFLPEEVHHVDLNTIEIVVYG
jgi:hypothetical protein